MFTSLFSLILLLLLVGVEIEGAPLPGALALSSLLYLTTLGLILFQNLLMRGRVGPRGKGRLLLLAQAELLLYFFLSHVVLRLDLPYDLAQVAIALLLYFGGLYLFYRTISPTHKRQAALQLRFLLPFCLPFLLYDAAVEWFPPSVGLLLLLLLLLLFPAIVVRLWGCRPLDPSPLRDRLEQLCIRLNYRCAGLMTWKVMANAHTAAMIGIVPRMRYILFTDRLLRSLQPEEVEAVLAHEVGHSQRGHLLFYPMIFVGLAVSLGLYALYLAPHVESWIRNLPFAVTLSLLPYLLILLLYFRLLFGYLSRNLEREADLHIYKANLTTGAMIGALNRIAMATGMSHHTPSWHHYSIAERIEFLSQTALDPDRIASHHRKVRRMIWGYLGILFLATLALVLPLFIA